MEARGVINPEGEHHMKKNLVFVFACVALSACGGTIEAEEPSTLQSVEQQTQELICPSQCACITMNGGCGWKCGRRWNNYKWDYEFFTQKQDCNVEPTGVSCLLGETTICDAPCEVGTVYAGACVGVPE